MKPEQAFQKHTLGHLRQLIKGSGWRKKHCTIFTQKEEVFLCGAINIHHFEYYQTEFVLYAKPMALDPLYWGITNLPNNNNEPLSFRHWAWFRCWEIPFHKKLVKEKDPKKLAEVYLHWVEQNSKNIVKVLSSTPYSNLVDEYQKTQEDDRHAETYICSLIHEGKRKEALQVAKDYNEGIRKCGRKSYHDSLDNSFFKCAIRWLENN